MGIFNVIRALGNFKSVETVKFEIPLSHPPCGPYSIGKSDKVKLHEWKAYGYWARPRIRGVDCPNSRECTK